ncbi:hypothetical protein [Kitasatospora sp. CB01950]|uniref:hypothetical protein n=1 Tax=Kitasatospora sp. CB01950 TaxID=1703930 RepID=UPI000939653E|nr:hypothetical protein [Kitasatospora sp. CB01950]OKJ17345.1 hypothetical protein AMK19_04585 [Kitasatospora sp. CB01950]
MSGDGEELSVRMARVVAEQEASAPPSRVDPALAVLRGRRLRRRRTWTVAAVAAAVLAAGSVTVLTGYGRDDGITTAAPTPNLSGRPAPVSGRTVLTVPARFGWLPDTVTAVEYRSSSTGVEVVGTGSGPTFSLTAFPVGVTPLVDPLLGPGNGVRKDAPPVHGREAYWLTSTDPGFARSFNQLRFQGVDGRWYQVDSTGLSDADREQVPLRIAEGVQVGAYSPAMPVALSSMPPEAVVTRAVLYRTVGGADLWTAEVGFQEHGNLEITVSAAPDGAGEAGRQAAPPDAVCASENGVRRCVSEVRRQGAGPSDPVDWLARVVTRGTDDRNWSVAVLP